MCFLLFQSLCKGLTLLTCLYLFWPLTCPNVLSLFFQTFIILGKGNVIFRFNAEPSCFLFSPFSPVRLLAIRILIHSYPLYIFNRSCCYSLIHLFIRFCSRTQCQYELGGSGDWTANLSHIGQLLYLPSRPRSIMVYIVSGTVNK